MEREEGTTVPQGWCHGGCCLYILSAQKLLGFEDCLAAGSLGRFSLSTAQTERRPQTMGPSVGCSSLSAPGQGTLLLPVTITSVRPSCEPSGG